VQRIPIILGSTRDDRRGHLVAAWLLAHVQQHPDIQTEIIDLRDWPLPFFNESPQRKGYSDPIVDRWIERIGDADGYIIIAPEYNHSFSGALKNALDYGLKAWRDKPVGFVAYGGETTGGARAVEQLKLVAIELGMAPIRHDITLPGIMHQFDKSGKLRDAAVEAKVAPFLDLLVRWSEAMQPLHQARLVGAA
jgi:NAD(P)H-dependent FMN reductase